MFEYPYGLFTDKEGSALIFANKGYIDLMDLYKMNKDLFNKACFKLLNNIETLNDNQIYHNDLHFGNVLYDKRTEKIYLIDLESLTINSNIDNSLDEKFRNDLNLYLQDFDIRYIDKYINLRAF